MRKTYLLPLLFVPSALIWACGGGDNVDIDGGLDATPDTTQSDGPSNNDGSTNDVANDTSTSDASDAGQDVTITLDCFKPADCIDGGDPDAAYPPDSGVVCCGTVATNGQQQSCKLTAVSTTCKAPGSCGTDFLGFLSCTDLTVRLCESDNECTENGNNQLTTYNQCCTGSYGDASAHFCANSTIASQSQGRINCP